MKDSEIVTEKINWKDGIKALVAILKFGFSNNICLQDKK